MNINNLTKKSSTDYFPGILGCQPSFDCGIKSTSRFAPDASMKKSGYGSSDPPPRLTP